MIDRNIILKLTNPPSITKIILKERLLQFGDYPINQEQMTSEKRRPWILYRSLLNQAQK